MGTLLKHKELIDAGDSISFSGYLKAKYPHI